MEFIVLSEEQKQKYRDDILSILTMADGEFVPPLSRRRSTTQSDLSGNLEEGSVGILSYLLQMLKQEIMIAVSEGVTLGFVSYRENYVTDVIGESELPNIYVSTLIVTPAARGRGLTRSMYSHLFDTLYAGYSVFTRTWSTNFAHFKILESFGFDVLKKIENDRGEGIDTVYFKRKAHSVV